MPSLFLTSAKGCNTRNFTRHFSFSQSSMVICVSTWQCSRHTIQTWFSWHCSPLAAFGSLSSPEHALSTPWAVPEQPESASLNKMHHASIPSSPLVIALVSSIWWSIVAMSLSLVKISRLSSSEVPVRSWDQSEFKEHAQSSQEHNQPSRELGWDPWEIGSSHDQPSYQGFSFRTMEV